MIGKLKNIKEVLFLVSFMLIVVLLLASGIFIRNLIFELIDRGGLETGIVNSRYEMVLFISLSFIVLVIVFAFIIMRAYFSERQKKKLIKKLRYEKDINEIEADVLKEAYDDLIKQESRAKTLSREKDELTAELFKKNELLVQINRKLRDLSIRDELTGLYNYRYFYEQLGQMVNLSKRHRLDLACILIDIDFFKKTNDTYGHLFGDEILRQISDVLLGSMRQTDIVARYGGEEFALLLPHTDVSGARVIADKVQKQIRETRFGNARQNVRITVSMGIGSFLEDGALREDDFLKNADKALYASKSRGRDVVYAYSEIVRADRVKKKTLRDEKRYSKIKEAMNSVSIDLRDKYLEGIRNLVVSLTGDDVYDKTSLSRIEKNSVKLAESFGLAEEQIESIKRAVWLYALGKAAISDDVLKKKGQLNDEEYDAIKQYPFLTLQIVESVKFIESTLPIILYHREWTNGGGYPEGLKGSMIPTGARILAIVDAFEALCQERPYRKKLKTKDAALEIRRLSNIQFDPEVVDIFLRLLEDGDVALA